MKAKDIIEFMNNWAPKEIAEDWDNVGFQLGDDNINVSSILLALDLDHRVLEKAKENNHQMIITHHPFIFSGIKNINSETYDGRLIMNLLREDKVAFNAHTNLDKTYDGVNEELGKLFKLKDSYILEETFESEEIDYGYGRVGYLDEISMDNFIKKVKEILDTKKVTIFGNQDKMVKKIALVGGSGAGFIKNAASEDVDVLVTGDIKYHDGQLAEKLGITLIDAGHFHTEKIILPVIKEKLLEFNKDFKIEIYNKPSPLYKIV